MNNFYIGLFPCGKILLMEENITFSDLCLKFLTWSKGHQAPKTLVFYSGFIKAFVRHLGNEKCRMPAMAMKPYHVTEWIDSNPHWGSTYRGSAVIAIKRVYNWSEEQGYVDGNPIKKLKKSPAQRRENPMKPETYELYLSHLKQNDPFRDWFVFMWNTGARPQEARHIEPRHVNLERKLIQFPAEESKGKRYPRKIYMNDTALEIIARLMRKHTEGKLFRNTRGDEWKKYAVGNRMERLSARTGIPHCSYDIRHGFATRKLIEGMNPMTLAALMGHRDGSMLGKVYSHVDKDEGHLLAALGVTPSPLPPLPVPLLPQSPPPMQPQA